MTVLWLLLSLLSVLAFYLACAHQRLWPAARQHLIRLRIGGWLTGVLSMLAAVQDMGLWAGVFSALTAMMLFAVMLPYLDAWRGIRRQG